METRSWPITSLDIIILVLVAVSALIGLFRGLMREVLSLVIWASAILGAMALGLPVGDWMALGSQPANAVAGYATVFVAVFVIGAVVQRLVAKAVDATGLSGADRALGLVFGGARGLAICLAGFILMRPFAQDAAWWQASFTPPLMAEFEGQLLEFVGGAEPPALPPRSESI